MREVYTWIATNRRLAYHAGPGGEAPGRGGRRRGCGGESMTQSLYWGFPGKEWAT